MKLTYLTLVCIVLSFKIEVQAQKRTVLIEEFGGTWCGHCPAAAILAEKIMDTTNNVIEVALHVSDVMSFSAGAPIASAFVAGYPASSLDRYHFPSINSTDIFYKDWPTLIPVRQAISAPVSVSATNSYNVQTRTIDVSISTEFFENLVGDYRFNCYIVEDSVTGSGTSYQQSNYYHDSVPYGYVPELFGRGSKISDYTFKNVARALLGGTWGTTNVIDINPQAGSVFNQTYNYVIPQQFDDKQISLVYFIHQYDVNDNKKRSILNAGKMELNSVAAISESTIVDFQLSPNPSSGKIQIKGFNENEFNKIEIRSLLGEEVLNFSVNSSLMQLDLGVLPPGVYFVNLSNSNTGKISSKIRFIKN